MSLRVSYSDFMPETKPWVKGLGTGDPEYRNDRFDYWESLDRIPISKNQPLLEFRSIQKHLYFWWYSLIFLELSVILPNESVFTKYWNANR